jgi:hypothetical protein
MAHPTKDVIILHRVMQSRPIRRLAVLTVSLVLGGVAALVNASPALATETACAGSNGTYNMCVRVYGSGWNLTGSAVQFDYYGPFAPNHCIDQFEVDAYNSSGHIILGDTTFLSQCFLLSRGAAVFDSPSGDVRRQGLGAGSYVIGYAKAGGQVVYASNRVNLPV